MIIMEKFIVFLITIVLIANVIITVMKGDRSYYLDKLGLLTAWVFLVFYDTRKIWPYSNIRLQENKVHLSRENVAMLVMILVVILAISGGTILPFIR